MAPGTILQFALPSLLSLVMKLKQAFNIKCEFKMTHQAPADRFSWFSRMVSVVVHFCLFGRTDVGIQCAKIMTLARWVKISCLIAAQPRYFMSICTKNCINRDFGIISIKSMLPKWGTCPLSYASVAIGPKICGKSTMTAGKDNKVISIACYKKGLIFCGRNQLFYLQKLKNFLLSTSTSIRQTGHLIWVIDPAMRVWNTFIGS